MGFSVKSCSTGQDAVGEAKKKMFDLAITDLRLRSEDGLDVTEELLRIHPGLPVIILTAHGSIPNAVEAMQRGAFGYLTKPFDGKELKATIEKSAVTAKDESGDPATQIVGQRTLWPRKCRRAEPYDAAAFPADCSSI